MIEADAEYSKWAQRAIELNNLPNATLINSRAEPELIISLLPKYPLINVMDFDIQEAELIVVPNLFPMVTKNVLELKIGIHGTHIYTSLTKFMETQQEHWEMTEEPMNYGIYADCETGLLTHDFSKVPQSCLRSTPFGPLYMRDGELVYKNKNLRKQLSQ